MAEIAKHGSGFVYLISRLGVTGVHEGVAQDLPASVARLRAVSDLPICVGFGISTPQQARAVGDLADGVVVGSALVRILEEQGVDAALEFVRALRAALDGR
jgi:tryptophan synthase alpha chain